MTVETEAEPLTAEIRRLAAEHNEAVSVLLVGELEKSGLTPGELADYGDAAALIERAFSIAREDGRKLFAVAEVLTRLIKDQKPFAFARQCLRAFDALTVEDVPALLVLHDPMRAKPKHGSAMWGRRIDPLLAAFPNVSPAELQQTVARLQFAGLVEAGDMMQSPQGNGPYALDGAAKFAVVSSSAAGVNW
jgi:hypothetical protein